MFDTIIIGGGISGFSAAMYAGRLKMKTLVITKIRGGTIILTNEIANWPGIKMTDGMSLAKQVEEHALEYDVEVEDREVVEAKKTDKGFTVKTNDGKEFEAKTVIMATGADERKLNIPGEKEFTGKGVHTCALCDGYFYKDKTIGGVGGSDSAAKEALLLTQWAKKVYIIYRKEKIRAEPINYERVQKAIKEGKMEIINNTNVVEINGEKNVNTVVFDKEYNGKKEFSLDGLFIEIGMIPNSQLAEKLGVKLNEKKEIIINRGAETNVKGVFAAGDVVDTKFKQAITGSAEAVLAAYSAYESLK